MKRRWVYQLLDEAPFPMLVLAFAVSQCPPDSQGLLNELLSARRYRKSQLLALPGQ